MSNAEKKSWKDYVKAQVQNEKLKAVTCPIYSANINRISDETTKCICRRLVRKHSYTGQPVEEYRNHKRWVANIHAKKVELTIYGQLINDARVLIYFT